MSFDFKVTNGSISFLQGDLALVTGAEKLNQEILKIALTPIGGNFFNPAYGSYFSQSLIGSYLDADISTVIGTNQLKDSLENLKTLQDMQQNQYGQQMLPSELLAAVQNVSIVQDPSDPRSYFVSIQYISKAFTSGNLSFSL